MSEHNPNAILEELRQLIAELGKDGGKISPSIYDTAQRLRFYPPTEGVEPALAWLVEQQHMDGGWCDPDVPAARDASTLAALLALAQYRQDDEARGVIRAGLAFLQRQAAQWADIPLDGLPIAVEVVLPRLLSEAQAAGLEIDMTPYARLCALGRKKLEILSKLPLRAGSAPVYSWEAFGTTPTPDLLDRVDSVGHSPAATARWLQLAQGKPELSQAIARAEAYLERAHRATDTPIPGVLPVVFPITSFELCYAPYALLLAGILCQKPAQPALEQVVTQLRYLLTIDHGVGFGDGFVADVDDTAVATAVLETLGYEVDGACVMQFRRQDHFFTFAYELNPSVFSNAHAVHALALQGRRVPEVERFLLGRQQPRGEWPPDKWHTCWRYTTLEVMSALVEVDQKEAVRRAVDALRAGQQAGGGWARNGRVSVMETVYSVIGLGLGERSGVLSDEGKAQLEQGLAWLQRQSHLATSGRVTASHEELRWLSKEVYSPRRVDLAYRLAALLMARTHHPVVQEAISV